MNKPYYEMLFRPGKIGSLELKNRIVMPPMVTNYATREGAVTEQYKDYLRERAKGGVGLVIVEATYVHPWGKGFINNLGIDRDELIPGLRQLAEVVHDVGAKIAIQLYHAGRQTSSKTTGCQPIAPSPIPTPGEEEIPKEATIEEIREVVEAFGEGARRAKEAGFDAVEIHGTHGYIINEFLSPYSNKREDEYGKDFEGRLRLAWEVLQRIKEKAGSEFPVIYRINGDECVEGGLTLEVTKRIAKRLQEAGADAFHVTAGVGESNYNSVQPMAMPRGCKAHLAAGVKEVVSVPIINAGRINHPSIAEEILEQNKADFVAMGRALLCDPEMPNKSLSKNIEDIRICIACNQKCISELVGEEEGPIGCILNVRTGREAEFPIRRVDQKKKVLIVGAGPAGLEAARIAALRGHRVDLFEKDE
ncbi:MAG: tRNA-dihydrouridine synthase, partial [bacterium]